MTALKKLRERCGLSQEAIAQSIGVSRSAVAMWETNDAYPRGKTLARLADALHCTIDQLYGREPPEHQPPGGQDEEPGEREGGESA